MHKFVANQKVIISTPSLQKQAEMLEAKIQSYPHFYNRLMPELQKIRAEILIKG